MQSNISKHKIWRILGFAMAVILSIAGLTSKTVYTEIAKLCSEEESKDILNGLCETYHNDQVSGNMCSALCDERSISFITCLNWRVRKQSYMASYENRDVVIKSQYYDSNNIPQLSANLNMTELANTVARQLHLGLPVTSRGLELVKRMSSVDDTELARISNGGQMKLKDMQSMWSLLMQNEYAIIKYLQGSPILPHLYGTCGHFYILESSRPWQQKRVGILRFIGGSYVASWRERVNLALDLLRMVHQLKTAFEEELHLCDITVSNLGSSKDGTLKVIDLDEAFFQSKIGAVLQRKGTCQQHEDCDKASCLGWCDATEGKCLDRRLNNNLQLLCLRIFMPHRTNNWVPLLMSPPQPVQDKLRDALKRCAAPSPPAGFSLPGCQVPASGGDIKCPRFEESERKLSADDELFRELYEILEKSLQYT